MLELHVLYPVLYTPLHPTKMIPMDGIAFTFFIMVPFPNSSTPPCIRQYIMSADSIDGSHMFWQLWYYV
jgi:hypothetical protein